MNSYAQKDQHYMKEALQLAEKALSLGEVPIGAVVVLDNEIIGRGYNDRESNNNPLGHGEIMAIKEACDYLGSWRLTGATIYITAEPCAMCSGAIINSRISRVVYGVKEEKTGCGGSVCNLFAMNFPHHVDITTGVMEAQCQEILQRFFQSLRNK